MFDGLLIALGRLYVENNVPPAVHHTLSWIGML
jgi:hypothetical protein